MRDANTGEVIRHYPKAGRWPLVHPVADDFFAIGFDRVYRYPLQTADELLNWTMENRYLRDLTCEERSLYHIEPLCDEGVD